MTEDAPDADPPDESGDLETADSDVAGDASIQPLDRTTVERIAAGEVVERPASVVKELVENSLDADARRIDVEIDGDGTDRIAVVDDGSGMTEADLRLAVKEHTTSKIDDIDDLEAGIHTLGFRGEALHTIGAVSRTTIRTKPRGSEGAGTELRYEGGETVAVEPVGCPEGTTIEVSDLFYNTPARRKFLKTDATEFAHVNRIASRYALANPDVAVSLTHDGRETFATTGDGNLRAAIMSVYGREVAEAMIPVTADDREAADGSIPTSRDGSDVTLPDGPLEAVAGFVSHPETTRSSRDYVSTYVNGRWVDAAVVREGVLEAYGGQLAADRYPFAVLFLELPADSVDVNVHPRKMEVNFERPDALRRQVEVAVKKTLLDAGILRSSAPRGRSSPEQTTIDPSKPVDADGSRTGEADEPTDSTVADEPTHAEETNDPTTGDAGRFRDGNDRAGDDADPTPPRETGVTRSRSRSSDAPSEPSSPDLDPETGSSGSTSSGSRSESSSSPRSPNSDPSSSASESDPSSNTPGSDPRSSPSDSRRPRSTAAGEPDTQTTLTGSEANPTTEYDSFPDLRVLGQLHDTYVVAEADDGLLLVDQHAADERVNYERLRESLGDDPPSQVLAEPVELELTPSEAALFEEYVDSLADVGFDAERVDDATVVVRSVPAAFDQTLPPELLRDVLAEFVEEREGNSRTVRSAVDDLLADLACHPSITGNTSLTDGSVSRLLSELDDCEDPFSCPHGRPVFIQIDADEIDDRFERDYPGGH